ncbi:hypothetical protein TVAG_292880 [Trichomonas vaginalis G3]|uniref:Uncharacterized protein n=1 Tax=Trichomonas vaginalis (strain ATCC PRA-98 / G3) TaxID=412133 RepID=A2EWX8_TRIV3|nr:hypothetical protein TVAGG3_0267960 [Trichomonas vaginalis G3]EAY02820.1 hypothetical protein TVAG_292880 [Trichomonas vaginalis G3]KAI5525643.1 hypothetical protein TVAGG3_0267960 [Trichomonas vaginalis G3]|eukprot:XP_001315043.1 hypothetical protein [Trichomonas vaginalis G3]
MTEPGLRFYTDYELYKESDIAPSPVEHPDVTLISALPTSTFGAYMESFTPNFQEPSWESIDYSRNCFSFTDVASSFDSDGSFLYIQDSPPDVITKPTDGINTPQIELFWQRYNEYPQYLKKIKKRNRRKAKKGNKNN